ncbi:MAG: hypothetical protein ACQGVC_03845 [Myxococcota bacterium]
MSDDREPADLEDPDDEEVSSPFDHPLFLPVLLLALSVWFGWDGWFSETIESVRFNRYGFFFLLGATAYFLLADFTKLRFLLPGLFAVYGAWLGAFHFFGSDDAWWRDDPGAQLFNRWGALGCLGIALLTGVRELFRKRPA